MDMRTKRNTKKKAKGTRGRLKTWRLRSATEKEFKCEVEKIVVHSESAHERWNSLEHGLMNVAETVEKSVQIFILITVLSQVY